MILRLLAFASLLFLFASPAAVFAQGKPLSCDDNPACARLAEDAYTASTQSRYDDAQRIYEEAYQRVPDPKLLYNVARVLHKAGRPAVAATYYQKYIDVGAEGRIEQRRKAEQYLEQAQREAAGPPVETAQKTPVYRKWWLWTTVGVVVAGVAIGLGVGLAARRPDQTGAVEVIPFGN